MFNEIVDMAAQAGYLGVFLLMLAENIFPPIPSELIMPLAGFAAARGDMDMIMVILAGTAGSVVGALPWYYAGLLFGKDRLKAIAARHGRWLTMTPADIDQASDWFARYGISAVFFGRLVPAVRTLISVPAGIVRMRMLPFLFFSTVGSLLWTAFLAFAGYVLESQYELIEEWIDPISKSVMLLIIGIYLYRFIRFKPQQS
ncbi:alkaline phosphatase [Oxalicibacterium flavum]|uniref:Alkaline phosphatase n=1 Tax=Oxalicibacterium flavum TaxID=179467 RepID=A0A8J2UMF4_9BURK|nr:DedA family protein [Oxalicibacterium flavum]GGC05311.1 alkaline phosphatase [Oxalicibacterium flavum]